MGGCLFSGLVGSQSSSVDEIFATVGHLGPVVRNVDKVIHRIATFSNVLKLLIYWNAQIQCLAFQS